MLTPCFSKLLHKITTHKLVISLSRLLEGLPYDGDEQLHRDCAHNNWVGEKEDSRGHFWAAAHWVIYSKYLK